MATAERGAQTLVRRAWVGRVCSPRPAEESWEVASWGAGPPRLGQPALGWKAAKPGLAQRWQRLEKP